MVSQQGATTEGPGTSRGSILEAATNVFMEVGFSGARVDEIARRARANKAMIYYHFGSKQGLYKAALLRLFGNVLAEVKRLKESDLSPEGKLRALYTRIARHFSEQRALPHIMLREILAGGRSMDVEASHALGAILGFVKETVAEGTRTGAFRSVHPLLLHVTMLGPLMLHFAGASFRERLLPRELPGLAPPSNDDVLVHLLAVLDRSLAPENPKPSVKSRQRKTR